MKFSSYNFVILATEYWRGSAASRFAKKRPEAGTQTNEKPPQWIGVLFALLVAVSLCPISAQAQVPPQMNFQAKLLDKSNNPINATVSIVFSIYNVPTGGTALWTETQPSVTVSNGVYDVEIGSVVPLSTAAFSGGTAYLGIKISPDTSEMTPREKLVSSPYSLVSSELTSNGEIQIQAGGGGVNVSTFSTDGNLIMAYGITAATGTFSGNVSANEFLGSGAGLTALPWGSLTGYPAACAANEYVSAVGGTLTCSIPSGTGLSSVSANASLIGNGTIGSPLGVSPSSGTLQGNTFNGASELVQLNSSGDYPALNGSNITSLTGANVSGNIPGNAANVTGTVAIANGGTGATTVTGAQSNLNIVQSTGGVMTGTLTMSGGSADIVSASSITAGEFFGNGAGLTSLPWSSLTGYPTACSAGEYVSAVGGSLTCSTPTGTGVSGSGTTDYVAKFTGTGSIGNSLVYDNGTDVGIGTTSPGANLDVFASGTQNNLGFRVSNATGTIHFVDYLGASGYNPISQLGDQGIFFYGGSGAGSGNLVIAPWSSTLSGIRMTSAGNVGIGSTNPSAKLQVVGQAQIGEMTDGNAVIDAYSGDAYFGDNTATNGISVNASGYVGIGTTSPSTTLDVNGTATATTFAGSGASLTSLPWSSLTGYPAACAAGEYVSAVGGSLTCGTPAGTGLTSVAINSSLTGNGTGGSPLGINLGNANTWTAAQTLNGGAYFPGSGIWNTSGNVGIGTTSPAQTLEVNGTSLFTSTMTLPNNIATNKFEPGTGDGASYTTYDFALQGWWGMALKDYSETVHGVYDFRTGNLTTDGLAYFGGPGSNYFAGNVGIGTASPTTALDVNGTATATTFAGSGTSLTNLPWSSLTGYPSACSTGEYVSAVGGSLTCGTPAGTGLTSVATNSSLTGNGTGGSPLGINLGNANTWTAAQTFNGGASFPASGLWNTAGVSMSTLTETGLLQAMSLPGDESRTVVLSPSANDPSSYYDTTSGGVYIHPVAQIGLSWYGNYWWLNAFRSGSTPMGDFSISYGTTDYLRIQAAGNVGIGTTSPSAKLDVIGGPIEIGSADFTPNASLHIDATYGGFSRLTQMMTSGGALNLMSGNSGTNWWSWGVDSSANWNISPGTSFGTSGLVVTPGGHVGVGISPNAAFNVYDTTDVSKDADAEYNGDSIIQAATGGRITTYGAQLEFVIPANTDGTNFWGQGRIITVAGNTNNGDATGEMILGTRRMYNKIGAGANWYYGDDITINGSGYVGINTTNPSALLDVNGAATANTFTSAGSLPGANYVSSDFLWFQNAVAASSLPSGAQGLYYNSGSPGGATFTGGLTIAGGSTYFGTSGSYDVTSAGAATLATSYFGGLMPAGGDNTGNIGTSTDRWTTIHGVNFYGVYNAGPDLAERYPAAEPLEPGDVVIFDKNPSLKTTVFDQSKTKDNHTTVSGKKIPVSVLKSTFAYESGIVGVVSTAPGVKLHDPDDNKNPPIALIGRVPIKVDLEGGSIHIGDYLTSSSKPGYAMKATEAGPTLGIALEEFDGAKGETGKILGFVHVGDENEAREIKNLEKENSLLQKNLRELTQKSKTENQELLRRLDSLEQRVNAGK